jgi:glycosyltransferase involved in cell wall biosynthesis
LATVAEAGEAFPERGWEMGVVVCDNKSANRTCEIAEAAGARVVFEKHNQISRARNAAGNAAKGEWIIFIDADSKPSKALFKATAVAMRKREIIGGGATVMFEGGKLVPSPFFTAERIWNRISRVMR